MKNLILILICYLPFTLFSQLKIGKELTVVHFNATWNASNNVKWLWNLSDAKIKKCDIAVDVSSSTKYEIVVVPTIIIFDQGKEVKRYQADISFSIKAKESQVQDKIDEIQMSGF